MHRSGGRAGRWAVLVAMGLALALTACAGGDTGGDPVRSPDRPAEPASTSPSQEEPSEYSENARASLEAFPTIPMSTSCVPEGDQAEYQWYRTDRSLAVDPRDPDRLLVAVERLGLFESLDRGETWRPMSTTGIVFDMRRDDGTVCLKETVGFQFDPYVPGRIYLNFGGTGSVRAGAWQARGSGVYVSDDDGVTWTLLTRPEMNSHVVSIVPDPSDPETLYVGTAAVILTNDEADPDEVFIERGLIYRIEGVGQGGTAWEELPTGWSAEAAARLLWLDPRQRGRIVMAVYKRPSDGPAGTGLASGWYESLDSGQTWTSLGEGAGHGIPVANEAIAPSGRHVVFRIQLEDDDATYVSSDGARTWRRLPLLTVAATWAPGSGGDRFYAIEDVPLRDGANPFLRSDDGGLTWRRVGRLPEDFASNLYNEEPVKRRAMPTKIVVDPSDPDVIYVSGAGGLIARSDDGGATWRLLTDWRSFPAFDVIAR